ncbi:hypothetical protein DB88DRAFT_174519 [Papiliotrema laurentii]|uniref:Uncharacterized protein n=1 Tax=Papiliotrema laurentii TaxID=5418 RepID=A0AAD9L8S8_PAPLA|nr:hypothetical protein DB88DRAFT_174519 [Papiliotrema laurentii]
MALRSSTLISATGVRGSIPRTPALRTLVPSQSIRHRSSSQLPEPDRSDRLGSIPPPSSGSSRLSRAYPALARLSSRTGVPLPSLGISFLILHEITAIVPVVLLFWLFQWLGLGLGLVSWIKGVGEGEGEREGEEEGGGVRGLVRGWYDEAEGKVERVGKRYGILGYTKMVRDEHGQQTRHGDDGPSAQRVGETAQGGESGNRGDTQVTKESTHVQGVVLGEAVADAIASYVVVKALLPLRLAASIGLAPAFARFALNPLQKLYGSFRRVHR